jgi:hypothetical protein
MAASLAASIQGQFGIEANLVEGHNGIYEVAVNGNTIYSNQSTCSSGFPTNEEIFQGISAYVQPLETPMAVAVTENNMEDSAPFCPLSGTADETIPQAQLQQTDCGCGSTAQAAPNAGSSCCTPAPSAQTMPEKNNSCCG